MGIVTRVVGVLRFHARHLLAPLALFGSLLIPAAHGAEKFTLTAAIPDTVFIVTAERFNPEREFLADEWAEVYKEFEESGIVEELADLALSNMGQQVQAEAERVVGRFTELFGEVEWGALGAGEIAFAERFNPPVMTGPIPIIGFPDFVVLFRIDPDLAEQNFAGMKSILAAMVEEINGAAGTRFALDEHSRSGAEIISFNLFQLVDQAPIKEISIGRREDVLFLTMGTGLRDEMLGLLSGEGDARPVTESARFQAAFKDLPAPEDGFEYVDVQALTGSMEEIFESFMGLIEEHTPAAQDRIPRGERNQEAVRLSRDGYATYEAGDNERALLLTAEAHEVDPKDSIVMYNMACLHALIGNSDQALYWLERCVEAGFHAPDKLQADTDLKSIRNEPRFLAAVESAKQGAAAGAVDGQQVARNLAGRVLGILGMFDTAATVRFTEGRATHSESVTALVEGARQNPFYEVIASGEPLHDFAQYLPQATGAFQVSSSIDLDALYAYLLATVADLGEVGTQALATWEQMQLQMGLDVRKDVLAWIGGGSVSATFQLDGKEAWISMMKVTDEAQAREKLDLALTKGLEKMAELTVEIPQLAMLSMRTKPVEEEGLEGFHELTLMMAPQQPMACGVRDGWLIFGSSKEAVLMTLETGKGDLPNVRENQELMARASVPQAPAGSVTFQDHRKDAEEMAGALGSLSMVAGMAGMAIPEQEVRETVMKMFDIVSRLAPVVAAIDFYESTASHSTFDGMRWRISSVTHYVKETASEAAPIK